MNPVSRGIRNAFRNGVRTMAVILILGLSIGLSLTMLVANKAVANKIASVKSSIGTTVKISPAGFNPGSQANNALTTSDLDKVRSIPHVTGLTETLTDRLSTTGSAQPSFGFGGRGASSGGATTSLTSPVKLNFNNGNNGGSDGGDRKRVFINGGGGGGLPSNFSLPVSFLGTSDPAHINDSAIQVISGKTIGGSSDTNDVLISTDMASKNGLKAGSSFTAYSKTLTVGGIFSSNGQGASDTVVLSLPAEQRLSGQSGSVTSATATVDSLDNLSGATSAVKKALGGDADVVSAQEQADNTIKPLNGVKTVSFLSLVGAALAGAVIILLMMVMVVRERKREIGVTKAIGGSNLRIINEFAVEALTLTLAGAVVGLALTLIAGQPVTNALVDNSTNSSSAAAQKPDGQSFRVSGGGFGGPIRRTQAARGLQNINAEIGWGILLDGLGAAVLIAVIGSALSAGIISKVRPSEILRSV